MAQTAELRALHLMVKHYEGGLEGMALILGISADLLGKKLRDEQGHKLHAADIGIINESCIRKRTTHCFAYINCLAGNAGMSFNTLPVLDAPPCIAESSASVTQEMADMAATVIRSIADNDVNDNELKRIEKDGAEAIASIQNCLAACRAKNRAGKAARGE